jgi:hypothetical protein
MDPSSLRRGRHAPSLRLSVALSALAALAVTVSGAAVLLVPSVAAGAPTPSPTPVWVASTAGPGGTAAGGRVVVRDPASGAVYVAGVAGVAAGGSEILVVAYDAAGAQQWSAVYHGTRAGACKPVSGVVDRHGDFVVLCKVRDMHTQGDWAVLAYGPGGARIWTRTIVGAGGGNDLPSRLALSPTGAIYAVGGLSTVHRGLDAAVVKLTATGKVAWRRLVRGPGTSADEFTAMGLDSSGRVFCAGTVATNTAHRADCLMAAFGGAGRALWATTWGGSAQLTDTVHDLVVTPGGKAYAVGSYGTASGSRAMIRQYSAAGRFIWQGTYTAGSGRDVFTAAARLPGGGVVATGTFVNAKTGNSNIVTAGFAAHGPSLWQQTWDTPFVAGKVSHDYADGVAVGTGGQVFVSCGVASGGSSGTDYGVLSYTSSGTPRWNAAPRTWDSGTGDDLVSALALASAGVIVTGQERVSGGSPLMATVEIPY